ncbi:TonB-dependent receptor [Dysgonomonas sp. ZJ709]|uniref:TonB-dependent receptor n=1 Tax=Dysgonomonas sp. ZJ709 TaxID=2709797 RepID=UPI0013EC12FD
MKNKFNSLIAFLLFLFVSVGMSAQTIRGVVVDYASGSPLSYVTIGLLDKPEIGTMTDSLGRFSLKNVPVGRHTVQATSVGYEPNIFREILVTSAKEVYLEIPLTENIQELGEVVFTQRTNKDRALNSMATTGARMLSVEEANRFAGGMDDPARLVGSFAGVVSSVGNNGISVHGNAPHLLQWKLEDVEIPNPNHFADISTLGGGVLSSLSSNVLGNSDFFTGAFPGEYGNAVSGVFDMKLRNGNNQKYENAFQIGILGIDFASEGPFSKKHNSSYIFNYRYSTTSFLDLGGNLDYQDLNFKVNFPTKNAGVFSVWGTALLDKFTNDFEENPDEWEFMDDNKKSRAKQSALAAGVTHRYFFNSNSQLKTTLATTYASNEASEDAFDTKMNSTPTLDMDTRNTNLIFNTSFNRKFSSRFTSKTGFTFTRMFYNLDLRMAPFREKPLETISQGDGSTNLIAAYTSAAIGLSDKLTMNLGVNSQILTLNNSFTIEPRVGMKWQASNRASFAVAYGLHSRMEKMDVFYVRTAGADSKPVNQDLDFTKAHHLMLTFNYKISDNVNLKIEPYFQSLFDVPVIADSSYSVLNRKTFYVEDALVNKGKGRNYGVDLTLERYLDKGFYYMLTGSVFSSKYKGGDGVWHNTKFNRNYAFNVLVGKEWMMGSNKQNILGANLRFTLQGGERYSPVDVEATMEHPDKEVQYDETRAYSKQLSPMFVTNASISYKMNKKKVSHEFAINILNLTGYEEFLGHQYNLKTGEIELYRQATSLPNISYKLHF